MTPRELEQIERDLATLDGGLGSPAHTRVRADVRIPMTPELDAELARGEAHDAEIARQRVRDADRVVELEAPAADQPAAGLTRADVEAALARADDVRRTVIGEALVDLHHTGSWNEDACVVNLVCAVLGVADAG